MFDLTEWERTRLSQFAASNFLTYATHHARGGLRPNEIEEMERWEALAEKLALSPASTANGDKP